MSGLGLTAILMATMPLAPVAPAVTVTSIDKAYSDTLGGRTRRILGSGFTGATASNVLFGATAATSIVVVNDTTIDALVPAHVAGLVAISVFGISLANAIRFWDPSVPGTPTLCVHRGGYSKFTYNGDPNQRHWVRRFGSLNLGGLPVELRADTAFGARADVTVEGEAYMGSDGGNPLSVSGLFPRSNADPPDGLTTDLEALFGGSNPNLGGTLLVVGNTRNIVQAPGAAYLGDAIYYDSSQNRGALLVDTTPRISWMWWDGSFKNVTTPIATRGRFAVAVVRDVTTSPGTPFMKLTLDGSTWAGTAGSSPVGSVTLTSQPFFGVGISNENFHGFVRAMAWYKSQLTATDITNFYGWYDAEFPYDNFPASDNPNAWYGGASFAGVPWVPSPSEGMSGGCGNLVTLAGQVAPGVGATVDGYAPATFDGATQAFQTSAHTRAIIGDYVAAANNSPFTILVLAKATAATAISGIWYTDPAIVTDNGGWAGLAFTSSGVRAGFDGPPVNTPSIAQSTGQWFMAAMRYDAANLDLRVNHTDATPTAATGHGTIDNVLRFGFNYNASKKFQGETMQFVFFNRRLSNAELDAWYAHFKAKYPVMGLP